MVLMKKDKQLIWNYAENKNLKESSVHQYESTIRRYIKHQKTPLTTLINIAEEEEIKGTRWKHSTLYKTLLTYRNYLYANYSKGTATGDFTRIKALCKYQDIMIGEFPRLNTKNMNTSRPLTFNDLPTPELLNKVLGLCTPLLRAYILFASSSGCAKNEILHLTIGDFINATKEYHNGGNVNEVLFQLKDMDEIIPTWYLRRIKTNKYYTTFSSPESTNALIDYLKMRKDILTIDSKLFKIRTHYISELLRGLNDKLGLGTVNGYGRLRTHTLRKYHASRLYNDGLSIDTIDALQGRGKDNTRSAYFIEDTQKLKEEYIKHMGVLLVTSKVKEMSVKSPEYIRLEVENEELREYLRRSMVQLKDLEEAVKVLYNQK